MQVRTWVKIGVAALLAIAALAAAAWWVGQWPYITPGTHQVFHQDSNAGALAEGVVLLAMVLFGVIALNDRKRKSREAVLAGRMCAGIAGLYLVAVTLTALLTPRTVVSTGDSYCWDLWCMRVEHVSAAPLGGNTRYTAKVSIFADSQKTHQVPAEFAKHFFYVVDEQGRRFPLLPDSSFADADVSVNPGEAVKSSLTFVAPANAGRLYLAGDDSGGLPWVWLYFGSDLNPLHPPTILRVL